MYIFTLLCLLKYHFFVRTIEFKKVPISAAALEQKFNFNSWEGDYACNLILSETYLY